MTASRGRNARALLVVAITAVVAALTWRLRPTGPVGAAPDADIVRGCAWCVWGLSAYLCLATAAGVIGIVRAHAGLTRIAPPLLRRLLGSLLTVGLATSLASAPLAAAAPARHPAAAAAPQRPEAPALDWPGLAVALRAPGTAVTPDPGRSPPRVATGRRTSTVIVSAGDTLWSIAAHDLGPDASSAEVATRWHAWYAANRAVIGPDPAVIRPGQRLVPPTTASHRPTASGSSQ